ncbi:macrocin-O-methyltransferase [Rhodomicrobium vannielii ATCC 17100]|uniref:Macrocin-O-methyltransferase n=1 Tax=Rhodomicrobium vannielii (strain ATCC 17100 / DSM 162 / LMG 4299 / NCIMB 10020 / ATH 3.1.1) TaxID=648757 RepID=E3I1R4_RHOVT|nr:TylF/MycF family methyltransferase [Rhodomicrobium vannielii]ADP70133.1 macrocin-O-methyltransferase [Rhodomicrobium vannielii ATCC 17100]
MGQAKIKENPLEDVEYGDDKATSAESELRALYIDLLQKTLTNEIYGDLPMDPWSGGKYDATKRALGRDWPSQAMTMIGAKRMANLRQLTESVINQGVPGDFIETGVWRGGACVFVRGILKSYGVTDRRVWVADSFEGLPPPDPNCPQDAGDKHHTWEPLAISQEQVRDNFSKLGLLDDQVKFLKGWFKDTLPGAPIERLAILRLDGDMYGSTMDALLPLYAKVSRGGFVIVDDFGAVQGCRQAIADFRAANNITSPIIDIDGVGVFWQVGAQG